MPTLIDRAGVRADPWIRAQPVEAGATGAVAEPAGGDRTDVGIGTHRLVAARDWLARREHWLAIADEGAISLGVELQPDDEPAQIAADLPRLSLVAVHFPRFTDGRGYSIARELRERHGWRGELRATGDVLRDQLFYLARCGFDTFSLRVDQDVSRALAAFGDFSEAYQAAFDRRPLFDRRRALVAGTRP